MSKQTDKIKLSWELSWNFFFYFHKIQKFENKMCLRNTMIPAGVIQVQGQDHQVIYIDVVREYLTLGICLPTYNHCILSRSQVTCKIEFYQQTHGLRERQQVAKTICLQLSNLGAYKNWQHEMYWSLKDKKKDFKYVS